jgi:protein-S-isoprenylcysteine O-methyltransferase Ste14
VTQLLFWIVVAAVVMNIVTVVLSIVRPDHRVWPPPRRDSWQYVYNGIVSFAGIFGVVALGGLDHDSFAFHHPAYLLVGGVLLAGGSFALWGYLTLGVHASQGLGGALVTSGPYRYSRNPQYVGAIPAVLGWAIICNSRLALIAAALVSGWFVLVPFAEEPWCREHLGAAYEEYLRKVPRFLALHGPRAP